MFVSNAILTSRGGMTSHAALVARGWGKCCIVGCTNLTIDMQNKSAVIDNHIIHEGDWITLNGSKGLIYNNQLPLIQPVIKTNTLFNKLLQLINIINIINIINWNNSIYISFFWMSISNFSH